MICSSIIVIYLGSKNKLSKDLLPIIQYYIDTNNIEDYLEPFVGGGNLIDKVQCKNKYGYDIHRYLIALLKKVQTDISDIPLHISEQEYYEVQNNKDDYEDWYVGLVGFCASFSAKWFGGYARSYKADGITPRDMSNEAIRNVLKQSEKLKNIIFDCKSYMDINKTIKNYLIYCDPPYKNTTKYKIDNFDYDLFYEWCITMNKNNIVLISEYDMPDDKFKCIFSKENKITIDSRKIKGNRKIEKLFIVR